MDMSLDRYEELRRESLQQVRFFAQNYSQTFTFDTAEERDKHITLHPGNWVVFQASEGY